MSVRKDVYTNGAGPAPGPNSPEATAEEAFGQNGVRQVFGQSLGYARVSTGSQELALQLDALKTAGCSRIFTDTASGARDDRPELRCLLEYARPGDAIVVWRLDRLGRSVSSLLKLLTELEDRGVYFKSLRESWDTSTPMGKFVRLMLMGLAELERDVLRERVRAGLEAARARGRTGGRPTVLTPERIEQARHMLAGNASVSTTARVLGVSRASLYRWLESTKT